MRKSQWMALGALLGVLGIMLHAAEPTPPSSRPPEGGGGTLAGRLAKSTKLPEADVQKLLTALGPAMRDMLKGGNQVNIPGLGAFRVVRVPEHKDLVQGRPATVPAYNYVEFLPTGDFSAAANSGAITPAETVPPFEYIINPYQSPGQRTGTTRQQGTRTR